MPQRSASNSAILALLAIAAPLAAFAYSSPGAPSGYLNDFAHVIPASQAQAIEEKLEAIHAATGDEIAVATVASLGGDTIDNYAVHLFEDWGIGEKGKDNGILILVAPNEHQARIEVGYGLEPTVTDLQSGAIIRTVMIPAFKNNNYAGGISGAVDALDSIITGSPDAAQYSEPAQNSDNGQDASGNWAGIFFVALIVLNILVRILGHTRSWWLGGVLGAIAGVIVGMFAGLAIGIIATAVLVALGLAFDYIVSRIGPRGPGGSGRGGGFPIWPLFLLGRGRGLGGGSGSSSGGFGGFGGGSSGGGGASGSW